MLNKMPSIYHRFAKDIDRFYVNRFFSDINAGIDISWSVSFKTDNRDILIEATVVRHRQDLRRSGPADHGTRLWRDIVISMKGWDQVFLLRLIVAVGSSGSNGWLPKI